MRLIAVDEIKENDILGRSIYSEHSMLLLSQGVKLTAPLIDKLRKANIYYVYIEDEESKGLMPEMTIPPELKVKSVRKVEKLMKRHLSTMENPRTKYMDEQVISGFQDIVKDLFDELRTSPERLYNMVELMGTDMYTYSHSINVTVLSIILSVAKGYTHDQVKNIALGALMHDIGKLRVNQTILKKPKRLDMSEFEEMKNHTIEGYELIREDLSLSGITKQIVYGHHERLDGSGYPRGLKGEQISEYVRIVTICDMFDAMTSDRVYQRRMPIYQAVDILMAEAVTRIDPNLLKTLIDNIAIYRPGETVLLQDGRKAIVIDVRKGYSTRPILRIIEDPNRTDHYEIDLKYDLSTFIEEVVGR